MPDSYEAFWFAEFRRREQREEPRSGEESRPNFGDWIDAGNQMLELGDGDYDGFVDLYQLEWTGPN